jgi:hypothetical protein
MCAMPATMFSLNRIFSLAVCTVIPVVDGAVQNKETYQGAATVAELDHAKERKTKAELDHEQARFELGSLLENRQKYPLLPDIEVTKTNDRSTPNSKRLVFSKRGWHKPCPMTVEFWMYSQKKAGLYQQGHLFFCSVERINHP